MNESEIAELKKLNARNLANEANPKFVHPTYPKPFDDYPQCRFECGLGLFGETILTYCEQSDPYHIDCLRAAERAVEYYRSRVAYPLWSNRVPDYPVPSELDELSKRVASAPYTFIETATGGTIEWLFDYAIDLFSLRVFCVESLRLGEHPTLLAYKLRGNNYENPTKHLLGLLKKKGALLPTEPTTSDALTIIQRPDLSDYVEGWSPTRPDYDKVFYPEELAPGFLSALSENGVSIPEMTAEYWLHTVRTSIDPVKAKIKEKKTRQWSR